MTRLSPRTDRKQRSSRKAPCQALMKCLSDTRRRRGREAEGTRLLNEHTPQGYRGFESLRLRHFCSTEARRSFFIATQALRSIANRRCWLSKRSASHDEACPFPPNGGLPFGTTHDSCKARGLAGELREVRCRISAPGRAPDSGHEARALYDGADCRDPYRDSAGSPAGESLLP